MTNAAKLTLLKASGLLISTLPPALCTLLYFPLWRDKPAALLSGFTLLLLLISAKPLFKLIKAHRVAPSTPMIWLCLFLLFLLAQAISDEMIVISLMGFIGNLIGAMLYRLAARYEKRSD